jgi:RNA polymerase sigma factor (sigma-70 family)
MSNCNTSHTKVVEEFHQAQAGDRERVERLMRQHEGLVHLIIRRQSGGEMSYGEVLHEGRIGLWKAILRFDPGRGIAFSTYASVAIARQVWRAVAALARAEAKAETEQEKRGREEWFSSPPVQDLLEQLVEEEIKTRLHQVVAELPPKQRRIVRRYYGLDGQGAQTQLELGQQLGCTRQAIQYHLRRAKQRLRHPAFSASLRSLIGCNRRQDYMRALQPERRGS